MSKPTLLERLFPGRTFPLRVIVAVFLFAVFIAILKNAIELYFGGAGDFLGRLIGDLPYAILLVLALYYVVAQYNKLILRADSKLKSQARLVENITDAVVGSDQKFAVTSWNKAAERIYGYTAEEAMGEDAFELMGTEFVDVTREEALRRLTEGGQWKGETLQTRRDGSRIKVLTAASVVQDADGKPVGFVSVNSDITERIRGEEAVGKSEQRYRFLFENSPISLFEIDISSVMGKLAELPGSAAASPPVTAEGRLSLLREVLRHLEVVGVNRRALEVFEANSKEELVSRIGDIMTEDTIVNLAEGMAAMMGGSGHFVGETEARTLNGRPVFLSVDWSLVVGPEAYPMRYLVGFNDITQLKRAQKELKALATLPQEDPSPILRLTSDGTVAYSNAPGRLILKEWGCEVGGVAPESWRETVREALATKASRVVELEYGPVFYSFSVAPVPELGYVNLYARDVTERESILRALRESEAKFRSMFESSGVGIGIAAPDGRIIEANPALLSMVGYSEAESHGTRIQEYLHPDDLDRVMAEREKMMATGAQNHRFEARFRHKDGHYLWVAQTASSVKDADGRPPYTVAVLEDITSRKEAQEALKESEETFRAVMENAPIGMTVTHPSGRWTKVNRALAEMLGYKVSELVGESFYGYLHPDDARKIETIRKPLIDGSADSYSFEARWIRSDKRIAIAENNVSVVRDASGKPLFTIGQIEDITKRKDAEEALRESEERFRTIFESAGIGIGIASPDGYNIGFNETFRKMLGYPEADLLNAPILEHMVPEDREKVLLARAPLLKGKIREYQGEVRYITKGGGRIWVNMTASLARDSDGKPLYITTLFEDITERKRAEEQLKDYSTKLEETVRERTRALEEEHDRLLRAERMATVGRISTQVAHDIRNPLAAINTGLFYLKSVVSKEHERKIDETVKSMEGSVAHANSIMQDLLDFSRARQFESAPVDLGHVILEALSSTSLPGRTKVIRKLDPHVQVMGDSAKLLRVFVNLFRNAADAMPHGGRLTVSSEERRGMAVIMVRDTGSGIEAANMPKIFTPFFTTKSRGLGMGLAICKEVVEAHGGSIKVASKVKGGTTFTISLPLAKTT